MPLLILLYMANVTLFVRNIGLKGYTANLLIISQLQNGFIFTGPHAIFYVYVKYFRFLYIFYIIVYDFTKYLRCNMDNINVTIKK